MPYVDPQSVHNPATSTVAPASWGDAVRDATEYLARNKPHCRVYRTTTQSLTNSTDTAISFDAERFDVGGMHSTVTNTSRVTIPTGEGGLYHVQGMIEFASNSTGERGVQLRINGTTKIAVHMTRAIALAVPHPMAVATLWQFAAGDYVELIGFQNSGGALNVSASTSYQAELAVSWTAV